MLGFAERAAAFAFSPNGVLEDSGEAVLACGTVSGTLGKDFDTSASLELVALGYAETQTAIRGSVTAAERFHEVAWAPPGQWSDTLPLGIIAGALDGGAVNLWNAAALGENDDSGSLLATLQRHNGPANSLDFNTFQGSLLASGGEDGEVFIWSLDKPAEPAVYTLGTKVVQNEGISKVSWNAQVAHILGTMHKGGSGVVWDLRNKRAVLQFSNPDRKLRSRSLIWHPSNATQLLTASEDDTNPVIQMWDLRNAYSPIMEFRGHTAGVWGLSWSTHDTDLVVSTGKDGKILVWNTSVAQEASSETNASLEHQVADGSSGTWFFDVQWSPKTPGLLAASSFDQKVQLFSILQSVPTTKAARATQGPANTPERVSQPKHAPKWLKRPCGASFGFGGKFFHFSKPVTTEPQQDTRTIQMMDLQSDAKILERTARLENLSDDAGWQELCASNAESSPGAARQLQWKVLGGLLKHGSAAGRRELLMHLLGYDATLLASKLADFLKKVEPNALASDPAEHAEAKAEKESDSNDSEKPFPSQWILETDAPDLRLHVDTSEQPIESVDEAVRCALLLGDFSAAVDCLVAESRWADALVMAAHGTRDLFVKTQRAYLQSQASSSTTTNLARFVACVVDEDLHSLVEAVGASDWRAALCTVLNYASPAEAALLASALGRRLLASSDVDSQDAAVVCFIIAGDVDAAVAAWEAQETGQGADRGLSVVLTMEKTEALRRAVERYAGAESQASQSRKLAQLYSNFVVLVSDHGSVGSALRTVLGVAQSSSSEGVRAAAFRCYSALPAAAAATFEAPPSPFGSTAGSGSNRSASAVSSSLPASQVKAPSVTMQPRVPSPSPGGFVGVQPVQPESFGFGRTQNKSFGVPLAAPPTGGFQARNTVAPTPKATVPAPTFAPVERIVPEPQPNIPAKSPTISTTQLPTPAGNSTLGSPSGPATMPPMAAPPAMPPVAAPPAMPPVAAPPAMPPVAPPATAPAARVVDPAVAPTGPPPPSVQPTSNNPPPPSSSSPPLAVEQPPAAKIEPPKPMSEDAIAVKQMLEAFVAQCLASTDARSQQVGNDLKKRFAALFTKIEAMGLNEDALSTLREFCAACTEHDTRRAQQLHVKLTQAHWQALGSPVMIGLKRVIDFSK